MGLASRAICAAVTAVVFMAANLMCACAASAAQAAPRSHACCAHPDDEQIPENPHREHEQNCQHCRPALITQPSVQLKLGADPALFTSYLTSPVVALCEAISVEDLPSRPTPEPPATTLLRQHCALNL